MEEPLAGNMPGVIPSRQRAINIHPCEASHDHVSRGPLSLGPKKLINPCNDWTEDRPGTNFNSAGKSLPPDALLAVRQPPFHPCIKFDIHPVLGLAALGLSPGQTPQAVQEP